MKHEIFKKDIGSIRLPGDPGYKDPKPAESDDDNKDKEAIKWQDHSN